MTPYRTLFIIPGLERERRGAIRDAGARTQYENNEIGTVGRMGVKMLLSCDMERKYFMFDFI